MLKIIEMMRHLEEKKFGGLKKGVGGFFSAFSLSNFAKRFRDQSIVLEMKVNPEGAYYVLRDSQPVQNWGAALR